MEREREQLKSIIDEWNVNRLDLFELSQPNEVSPDVSLVCVRFASRVPSIAVRRPASQQQQLLLSSSSSRRPVTSVCVVLCTSRLS